MFCFVCLYGFNTLCALVISLQRLCHLCFSVHMNSQVCVASPLGKQRKQETGLLKVWGQPGLYNELQASKPGCLDFPKQNKTKIMTHLSPGIVYQGSWGAGAVDCAWGSGFNHGSTKHHLSLCWNLTWWDTRSTNAEPRGLTEEDHQEFEASLG